MATAGRTVAVSGVTVAVSLAGLLIFPQVFLRSMGFGGMSAVLIAMLAALTLLPALLAMLGPKVDALSVRPWLRRVFRRARRAPTSERRARRLGADRAQRHAPAGRLHRRRHRAVLLALALPFLRVQFGGIDERALPAGTGEPGGRRDDRAPTSRERPVGPDRGDRHAGRAGRLRRRRPRRCSPTSTRWPRRRGGRRDGDRGGRRAPPASSIAYDGDPVGEEARDLVDDIRAVPAPDGGEVLVGGQTARCWPTCWTASAALLPWMALMVVATTFVLLFLAFGSVVLPVKAHGDERAVARCVVRRAGLDLPGRPPVGVAGLHRRPASSRRPSRSWCWRSSSGSPWTTRCS